MNNQRETRIVAVRRATHWWWQRRWLAKRVNGVVYRTLKPSWTRTGAIRRAQRLHDRLDEN